MQYCRGLLVMEITPVGNDQALLEEYFARYGAWRFLAPT